MAERQKGKERDGQTIRQVGRKRQIQRKKRQRNRGRQRDLLTDWLWQT